MAEDTNDQVQPTTDVGDNSQATGNEAQASDSTTDVTGTEQSNKGGNDSNSSKLYKLPDGREVSADDLHKEYAEKLLPEFTRRSQRLAKLEREMETRGKSATEYAQAAVEADEADVLKNVDPAVKEAIVKIVSPVIERAFQQRDMQSQKEAEDRAFVQELDKLESEYPGGNGKPKFDREAVLKAMQEPGNRIFDPKSMFSKLHEKEFNDMLIREALKNRGGSNLEATGTQSQQRSPEAAKAPKDFREASERLVSRLQNESGPENL